MHFRRDVRIRLNLQPGADIAPESPSDNPRHESTLLRQVRLRLGQLHVRERARCDVELPLQRLPACERGSLFFRHRRQNDGSRDLRQCEGLRRACQQWEDDDARICGDCGTPLFTQSEVNAQFPSIRFPTLDDVSAFAPMLDIWTSSAQPWVCLDEKLPPFAESPQEAR
jgi:hypothetical protein